MKIRMKRHGLVEYALAFALLTAVSPGALAQTAGDVAPVRVYDGTQITPDRYTVIKRLWVESWRSQFYVPASRDAGEAVTALVNEAARIGADGVVNLHCLQGGEGLLPLHQYFCYGNAIKLKNP